MLKRDVSSYLFNIDLILRIIQEVNVMAVKIRLKRLGEKKNPFYRIIVADSRSPRMVDLSMKSVLMILITIHASSTLMLRLLRSGYQTELSLQRLLESFSRWLVSKNKTSGGVIDYERISGNYR